MATGDALENLDYDASHATGLTREHWIRIADALLDGVRPYRSARGAHYDLPGGPARAGVRSDGLEGFARTFLLAAFRVAGTGESVHIADYVEGLAVGPRDDAGDESWQRVSHVGWAGQPMVESASIALGLIVAREHTWDALDAGAQDRLEAWLRGTLVHQPAPNNWYLFPMAVAAFLESVGRGDEATRAALERAIELLERWYRGDGWYSDGDGRAFDHYIGWAFHFYPPLLLAREPGTIGIPEARHRELRERYAGRLREFMTTFAESFDANGAPMYQGRSLTYRFATVASIGAAAATGALSIEPGRARRTASAAIAYFLRRGALAGGVLSRGWHGPHGASLQNYSGPASPYWASKAFAALLAPASDPFWTDPESADDTGSRTTPIRATGWLLQRTGDGHVRLHNHGSDHMGTGDADDGPSDPLYARYAYSTRTGPTALRNVADNHLAVVVRDVPSARHRIHPVAVGRDWAASWHVPWFPIPDPVRGGQPVTPPVLPTSVVTALTIARGAWDVRVFRLDAVPAGTEVRVTGWALSSATPADVAIESSAADVRLSRGDEVSELRVLAGSAAAATPVRAPQGTAYGAFATVPQVTLAADGGLIVVASRITTTVMDEAAPVARVDGDVVTVSWHEGEHRAEVREREASVVFTA